VRIIKGVIFWAAFSSLCAAVVLGTMRMMATKSGREDLYAYWLEDMKDALKEAVDFVSESFRMGET